jgi:hypothetical protein
MRRDNAYTARIGIHLQHPNPKRCHEPEVECILERKLGALRSEYSTPTGSPSQLSPSLAVCSTSVLVGTRNVAGSRYCRAMQAAIAVFPVRGGNMIRPKRSAECTRASSANVRKSLATRS